MASNVLVASPDTEDGVSWWRAWGPWAAMHDVRLSKLNFMADDPKWSTIEAVDVVAFNRPFKEELHGSVILSALEIGKPVFVDFDDLLWEIPQYNRASAHYSDKERNCSSRCVKAASEVTVSTPYLAQWMKDKLGREPLVIPNAFPDWYTWNVKPREKRILWRGNDAHHPDIDSVADEILAVAKDYPEWKWTFVGSFPWPVALKMDPAQFKIIPTISLPSFHRVLRTRQFGVMIVPLLDSPFNRAKSNIAWMEGTLSGARVVAPDFEEFRVPGVLNYEKFYSTLRPGNFYTALRQAIEEDPTEAVAASRAHIDTNLRLSLVNNKRLALLEKWSD